MVVCGIERRPREDGADASGCKVRGLATASFSATILSGLLAGPFISGFISESYLEWRWTCYKPAFLGFFATVMALIWQKESYGSLILVDKAKELRRRTRIWAIHAKQEEIEVDFREFVMKNVGRPLRMLFLEPITLLFMIYLGFIYGLLYLSLTAYTIVFADIHGFSSGASGLPLTGVIVGVLVGLVAIILTNPAYVKKLQANDNVPVPEWRLTLPMAEGISFAIGLFWFGWTGNYASVYWIVPTLARLCLGFGIFTVFLQCINYILDAYLSFSASAVAANTIMRSLFGAVFPLFATNMFDDISINWGCTFLGCVATLSIPMPFAFYFYGKRIRARSKFAPAPDIEKDKSESTDDQSKDV